MVEFKNVVSECLVCGIQTIVITEGFTLQQIQPSSLRWRGKCHRCRKDTKHRFLGQKEDRNKPEKIIFT